MCPSSQELSQVRHLSSPFHPSLCLTVSAANYQGSFVQLEVDSLFSFCPLFSVAGLVTNAGLIALADAGCGPGLTEFSLNCV